MSSTTAAFAEPQERLRWGEICAHYPDEWVVVTEIGPEDEEGDVEIDFQWGLVVGHHPRRREASAMVPAALARYGTCGCFFTGKIGPLPPRFA